jgi:hypothetical protein
MLTGFGLMTRLIFGLRKPRQPILGSEVNGVIALRLTLNDGEISRHMKLYFTVGLLTFLAPGPH